MSGSARAYDAMPGAELGDDVRLPIYRILCFCMVLIYPNSQRCGQGTGPNASPPSRRTPPPSRWPLSSRARAHVTPSQAWTASRAAPDGYWLRHMLLRSFRYAPMSCPQYAPTPTPLCSYAVPMRSPVLNRWVVQDRGGEGSRGRGGLEVAQVQSMVLLAPAFLAACYAVAGRCPVGAYG